MITEVTVSKPVYRVLTNLTGEPRFDVALQLATRELVQLKLEEAERQLAAFESKYRMPFEAFQQAWNEDRIPDKHSYEVERDYWEWEAATTDRQKLQELLDMLS